MGGPPPPGGGSRAPLVPIPYLQHGAQHGGNVGHPQAQQPIAESWVTGGGVTALQNPPPQCPPPGPRSPSSLENSVARDSDSPGQCGRTRSSIVTVASELKAEEMVLGRRGSGRGARPRAPPAPLGHGTHLREPLNRQATKRPGSPGRSFSTSITKYSTSWGPARGERGAGGRTVGSGGRGGTGIHLVGGDGAGHQRVLTVVDEHDEAGEAAEAEHDLLAGEDGVAGAAGATETSEAGGGGPPPRLHPTHSTACLSLRELRYRCTCAWFTPYSDSIMKTPPKASVQNVCRT